MRIFIKAINRVMRPGIRGGKYWIDRKGNVRYDVKGKTEPKAIDMASAMFMDNIGYFARMAMNIGNKFGLNVQFMDAQPVGDCADILAEGRLAAIKAYEDYFKRGYKNVDLKLVMRKRASAAMYRASERIKSQFNMSDNDRRHLKLINQYKDRYFNKYGYYPSIDDVAMNVKLINVNSGEEYSHEKKVKIIEGIGSIIPASVGVEDLQAEPEVKKVEFPRAEMMNSIDLLHKNKKISDVEYKIIQMYLGYGKYEPMGWQEIGDKLKMDRRRIFDHFKNAAIVLKPQFERYRGLLEKSVSKDKIKRFIELILGIE